MNLRGTEKRKLDAGAWLGDVTTVNLTQLGVSNLQRCTCGVDKSLKLARVRQKSPVELKR